MALCVTLRGHRISELGTWMKTRLPTWMCCNNSLLFVYWLGWVWGCHCRAWWHPQSGRRVEAQLHHLHRVQVLVLPHPVRCLRHPCGSPLGLPVRLHLLLPHLGSGALHQELPDRVAVHQPHLLPLHPDLLRSLLRGFGQDLQQRARDTAQRSLRTPTMVFTVRLDKTQSPFFLHTRRSILAPYLNASSLISCYSSHSPILELRVVSADMPGVSCATRSCVTAAVGRVALWQLMAQCCSPRGRGLGSVCSRLHLAQNAQTMAPHSRKWNELQPNTAAPVDNAACTHHIWP